MMMMMMMMPDKHRSKHYVVFYVVCCYECFARNVIYPLCWCNIIAWKSSCTFYIFVCNKQCNSTEMMRRNEDKRKLLAVATVTDVSRATSINQSLVWQTATIEYHTQYKT